MTAEERARKICGHIIHNWTPENEDERLKWIAAELKAAVTESIQILATERDAFGKRETELMQQLKLADELAKACRRQPQRGLSIATKEALDIYERTRGLR